MNSLELFSFTVACWKYGPRSYATIYDIFVDPSETCFAIAEPGNCL